MHILATFLEKLVNLIHVVEISSYEELKGALVWLITKNTIVFEECLRQCLLKKIIISQCIILAQMW